MRLEFIEWLKSGEMMRPIKTSAAAAMLAVVASSANAQQWPTRPLTLVAPFAAGGSTDAIARIVADGLGKQLHQSVVVENVGGGGGMTGANRVAKAAPDGYQFVLGNVGTHAQNQTLYKKPLYHVTTDFAPVGLIIDQALVLVTRKDFPANNLQDFIATAKANPSKLQYSSGGAGGSNHLAAILFNYMAGVDIVRIPYSGAAPGTIALIGGHVHMMFPAAGGATPHIKAGRLRALAVGSAEPSVLAPGVPTIAAMGVPGYESDAVHAVFAPVNVYKRPNGSAAQELVTTVSVKF